MNKKPFILGLPCEVHDSHLLTTEELAKAVGQNTGNLAFHYAIDLHFGGDLKSIDWGADVAQINAKNGCALLPCANQLGVHADLGSLADRFHQINRPIVAIGLGAQSQSASVIPQIPEGSLRWVKEIVEHAPADYPNITVRGDFTRRVLEQHDLADQVIVLGCPSFFINPDPALGKKIHSHIRPIRRIAVASGNPWENGARLESSLAGLVTATQGAYICQHPLAMLKLARGEASSSSKDVLLKIKDYICPTLSPDAFIRWAGTYARSFYNIPDWIAYLRQFDFVVGTRIHGIVLALQAEVPALCIAHDSRTLELCETMRIPYMASTDMATGITQEDIPQLFNFYPEEFDLNRAKLARSYVRFLRNNGLEPASFLAELYVK